MKKQHRVIIVATTKGSKTPLIITCELKSDVCYISIRGYIHQWTTASSVDVEKTIIAFKEKGAKKAELYINSEGGSVFEANEIRNLVEDNFSEENVKVKVGALAASAATTFLTKYKASGKTNSQFMIHKPSMYATGNEDQIVRQLKLLKDLTSQYRKEYAAKMGITEEEVEEMWKADYWMTAKEAKEKGLIDSIENEEEDIDPESMMRLVASGAPEIPEQKKSKPHTMKVELSILAVQIGLPADATQEQVDARLTALKATEIEAKNLKDSAEENEKNNKAARIKALLDGAEKDKKITAEQRPHFEKMAGDNIEACEALIKTMTAVTAISKQIDPKNPEASTKGQEKWTFEDYQKHPKAWATLEKDHPEKAKELIDAHYQDID